MKNMRRTLAVLLVLSAQLVLFSSAQISSKAAASSQYLAYVGTYTTKTNSKGMYVFRFDATTGKLSAIGIAAETRDPSWVAVHPNGKFLYAANEAGKSSTVSAFAIDAKSGKLTLLNQLPALGEDPCYLSFDKTGKYVANGERCVVNQQDTGLQWNPVIYTADLLVPIVDFGNKSRWYMHGPDKWVAARFTASGWILATTVAAGVSRMIRRDN